MPTLPALFLDDVYPLHSVWPECFLASSLTSPSPECGVCETAPQYASKRMLLNHNACARRLIKTDIPQSIYMRLMCTFGRTISVRINCVFTLLHSPRPHKLSHLSSAYVHIQASFIYAVHDVCDICDCGIQPPYTPIELLCIGHSIATLESSITHAVGTMPLRTNTHAHAITAQDRQTSERNSRREPRGRERESLANAHTWGRVCSSVPRTRVFCIFGMPPATACRCIARSVVVAHPPPHHCRVRSFVRSGIARHIRNIVAFRVSVVYASKNSIAARRRCVCRRPGSYPSRVRLIRWGCFR